jgi:hypothetical protein
MQIKLFRPGGRPAGLHQLCALIEKNRRGLSDLIIQLADLFLEHAS